ncbi:MAG: 50S ribosomal protein L18 [Candidatus Campbellbacteria bacterium]
MAATNKKETRIRRQARIRAKISGTPERPRFAVFRSNRALSVQLIDDTSGTTIVSGTTRDMKGKPLANAKALGLQIAKDAKAKKIDAVVFDRGGFSYTGNIAAVADGAREGGLKL